MQTIKTFLAPSSNPVALPTAPLVGVLGFVTSFCSMLVLTF